MLICGVLARSGVSLPYSQLPARRDGNSHDRRQHRLHDLGHERGPGGVLQQAGHRQAVHELQEDRRGVAGEGHQLVRLLVGKQADQRRGERPRSAARQIEVSR